MNARLARWLLCFSLVLLTVTGLPGQGPATKSSPASAPRAHKWIGPDGQPLPWNSGEDVLEYLRKARIGKTTGTKRGITQPRKVQLELDGVQANAIFHDVDEEKRMTRLKNETIMNFRDSYLFQIAAYELAQMIGLENVPPSVKRSLGGKSGSLTLWLESMITEEMRKERKMAPQGMDALRWNRQMAIMHVWDALIYNFDRNQGNILIDKDWNVWLIDHTRSFRTDVNTPELNKIDACERRLFERIRALNKEEVEQRLRGYVRPTEVDYLMKRRDLIVARIEKLVSEQGEGAVMFNYP